MAYRSWQEAIKDLTESTKTADYELLRLARSLKVTCDESDPRLIVIARIEDAVAGVTHVRPARPPTDAQLELLAELSADGDPLTFREADALIRYTIACQRCVALEILQPVHGDQLVLKPSIPIAAYGRRTHVEVSSVDKNGNVWIKGNGGYPIWPQHLARP